MNTHTKFQFMILDLGCMDGDRTNFFKKNFLVSQTPADNLMNQQCTFTPLYEVCLFSEGGNPQAP